MRVLGKTDLVVRLFSTSFDKNNCVFEGHRYGINDIFVRRKAKRRNRDSSVNHNKGNNGIDKGET